jgi:hypothetical protein
MHRVIQNDGGAGRQTCSNSNNSHTCWRVEADYCRLEKMCVASVVSPLATVDIYGSSERKYTTPVGGDMFGDNRTQRARRGTDENCDQLDCGDGRCGMYMHVGKWPSSLVLLKAGLTMMQWSTVLCGSNGKQAEEKWREINRLD